MRLILAATLCALIAGAPLSAATLQVTVEGIRVQEGELRLALYDSEEAWQGKAPPHAGRIGKPDGGSSLQFSFDELPPGRYALRVMHDENGNGKLDTNPLGIPKEGYGASNNPRVMRAPHFDEAAFEIAGDEHAITIVLN